MQLEKWLKTQYAFLTLSSLLALSITLLIYGRVIAVPFYSDDLLQIPWARTASLNEIWGTLNPFNHFRPIQFSAWRLWQVIAGDLTPAPLRLFNLLLHAGSGCLTGYLAYRLMRQDWWAGLGSTILFVLFPFSYDAILWISSAAYPLAVFLGLLSIHCWITSGRRNQLGWLYVALACAIASALSLESGILVGLLLVISDGLVLKRVSWQRASLALSASVIPLLIITVLTPAPSSPFQINQLVQNGAMVAQATTFPFSYMLRFGPNWFSSVLFLWLVGLAFVVMVALSGYRSKALLAPLAFALIWIALWGVIPAATQTYVWERDPPRAFYPCAVGIALVWGLLLTAGPLNNLSNHRRLSLKNLYRPLLGCALIVPVLFNLQTANYYQQAGQVLQQVLDTDQTHSILYLNLPERIGPLEKDKTWLLGYEGVIPMPPPTDNVALLLEVNNINYLAAANQIDGSILAPAHHELGLAGQPLKVQELSQSTSDDLLNIYTAEYAQDESRLIYLGQINTQRPDEPSFDFLLEERLALKLESCSSTQTDEVQLQLDWFIQNQDDPITDSRSIFVHLWQDGEIVDQADGQFLAGLLPINALRIGSGTISEQRRLTMQNRSEFSVGIGLYNPADGVRSLAERSNGDLVEDNYIWLNCSR